MRLRVHAEPAFVEKAGEGTRNPADRRVAIWPRARLRGKPVTTVAAQYGCRDASGPDRVIKRLEEKANTDRALSRHLKVLAKEVSSVKS